jgi:hypothetical protein
MLLGHLNFKITCTPLNAIKQNFNSKIERVLIGQETIYTIILFSFYISKLI